MTQSQKNTIESLRAEGLTYDKIASALNVSLSTVKMYFSRMVLVRFLSQDSEQIQRPQFPIYIHVCLLLVLP